MNGERPEEIAHPSCYEALEGLGFENLPDQSTMGAITFCDIVVSHERFTSGLLGTGFDFGTNLGQVFRQARSLAGSSSLGKVW
jgi:hypothetical protein